jgi:hypothetical protein
MSRDEGLAKLVSVRHQCFMRGVLGRGANRSAGGDEHFRQAFRTLNRLYVQLRAGVDSERQRHAQKPAATRRRKAA